MAYNNVGGTSTSTEKASQKDPRSHDEDHLTHVTGGATSVEAVDGSQLTTAALGVGGAGVSVNRINQDTTAAMSSSTVKDKHTTVQAAGDSAITSVGLGAAVAC